MVKKNRRIDKYFEDRDRTRVISHIKYALNFYIHYKREFDKVMKNFWLIIVYYLDFYNFKYNFNRIIFHSYLYLRYSIHNESSINSYSSYKNLIKYFNRSETYKFLIYYLYL